MSLATEANKYRSNLGKKVKLQQFNAEDTKQMSVQVNSEANTESQASFYSDMMSSFMVSSLSIEEQPTLIMPAIQDLKKITASQAGTAGYANQLRTLIKSSGIYALASLASPLVSLVLAPFLTRNLSHEDYGALAVITTTVALVAGLTQLGLGSAFFRSYNYDYESPRDRLGVLSTVVILLALVSLPIILAIILTAPYLAILLLRNSSFSDVIRLGALVVLMQNLTVPGFAWLRAENRAGFFTMLSITNLLVNLGTTLVLVGILHMGMAGSLIGTGSGFAVVAICTLPLILLRAGIHLRFDIARGLLSFGLPNASTFVSMWVLQLSDRYLLSFFGSLAQTASYAVAYSLGGILNVVILAPFTLAWPSAMFSIAKREDAPRIFRLVFLWYSIVLLFVAFALSLASMIMLYLFFPPTYRSAAFIIPIIALSTLFYGIYNIFTIGISIKRKTWFVVVFTSASALVNVGLNLVLIPHYGAMGAAMSTLLAYAFLSMIAYIVNQRIYPIPFEISTFIIALVMGTGFYVGSSFLAQGQGTYETWSIFLCALVLYGACLLLLGILSTRRVRAG
jgi:O-antigen/teichoic acid export membrane protein